MTCLCEIVLILLMWKSPAHSGLQNTLNYVKKLTNWDLWVDKQTFFCAFCLNTCFSYSLTYTKSGITWKGKTQTGYDKHQQKESKTGTILIFSY